ncbi:hypothetical protein GF339_07660 [candidate division KSB3 bacterium]|uniref:Uncharacterized protein n=1 Tax=candidate division KSB3 bacterium TaxID=2044937 RepID=A0A9D5Q5P0_9BACT|nr:hypothetical protein [candidate division KSB3 bacterium]MBD3324447.1 hypothetical protein [candidate division KSB3 bacterium]
MNRLFFIVVLGCCAWIFPGCQHDSDYRIGRYEVVSTVIASSCPEQASWYPVDPLLPTGFLPGYTRLMQWSLHRVGITGNGDFRVQLVIQPADRDDLTLVVSGTLEDGVVRIDTSHDLHEAGRAWYRVIVLRGILDDETFAGTIRTMLANIPGALPSSPSIPPDSPCEIHEEFAGRRSSDGY